MLAVAKGLFLSLFYTQLFLSGLLVSDMAILSSARFSGYTICTEFVRTSVLPSSRELASALPNALAVSVSSPFSRSVSVLQFASSPVPQFVAVCYAVVCLLAILSSVVHFLAQG